MTSRFTGKHKKKITFSRLNILSLTVLILILFVVIYLLNNGVFAAGGKDRVLPQITLLSPADTSTVLGVVPIEFQATDNVGIQKVIVYPAGSPPITLNSPPYKIMWDTTVLCNVGHEFYAVAYDLSGNKSQINWYRLNVNNPNVSYQQDIGLCPVPDNKSPEIYELGPWSDKFYYSVTEGSKLNIVYNGTDNIGITKGKLYVDDTLICENNLGGRGYTNQGFGCYWTVPKKPGKNTYTLKAIMSDFSNNATTYRALIDSN